MALKANILVISALILRVKHGPITLSFKQAVRAVFYPFLPRGEQ